MARLKEKYTAEVAPALMKKFEYKSPMQIPKLDKIILNMGLGSDKDNPKGIETAVAEQHPKNVIAINGNAKLISANDLNGFTFRGRFSEVEQAATVGYLASQKAHNAIRWLATEQGVRDLAGNRVYLCWNPQGKEIPKPMRRLRSEDASPKRTPSDFRNELKNTIYGFRNGKRLTDSDTAVLASFDAATTGRLAVTYYNEISMDTFLRRLEEWDAHCCWYFGKYGIQAPDLLQIVNCAFGMQRGAWLETDDRIQRQQLQKLLDCKVSGGVIPADIVKALVQRASTPLCYDETVWRTILHTACAVIQKYKFDTNQGGNEMAWELSKEDRSFQYGRLLAVMERAEADYYGRTQETRQTNAVKFMSEFRQRPYYVFERVNRQLQQAYLPRIELWQRTRYERLVGEIFGILSRFPEGELGRPLEDVYLIGYELQRNAFFIKNDNVENERED